MAQIVMKAMQLFCGFGGPYIAPFIIPSIALVLIPNFPIFISAWSILLLSIFTPMMLTPLNILNSSTDNGVQTRNGPKAFGFSVLIYYFVSLALACSIMQITCKVSNKLQQQQ